MRVGAHRVRPRSTPSEAQEVVNQLMTDDIDIAAITISGDSANLWEPDHDDPLCPSSGRRETRRTVSSTGGSPVYAPVLALSGGVLRAA
jgi:hypothetical protein